MESMAEDRRIHPRFDLMAQVKVKRGAVTHILDVKNISLSGVFVKAGEGKDRARFRVGQELDLDLFHIEELENISVGARVVRIVEDLDPELTGFGIQFVDVGDEARTRMGILLDRVAAAAAVPPPLPGNKEES